ncbi:MULTISPECIES: ATP-binding protein [Kocuria]|uniref:ATP-binding protein n=1 Tax=Kocuria TaxID=57493 RepID=UPI0009F3A416|nr:MULTISPECIES: ATP-binding protein [Kocuria]PKZ37497.1 ATP-binding protein [Kocuria rhizophila]
MTTLIAKVDHITHAGLAMLRLPDGRLVAGDNYVSNLHPEVGDVLVLGDEWGFGSDDDWEPEVELGVVEQVVEDTAIVRGPQGLVARTAPESIGISNSDLVLFNRSPRILKTLGKKPAPPPLFDDGFNPQSLRKAPNLDLRWDDFVGFPDIKEQAQTMAAVQMRLESRKKLIDLGVNPIKGVLFQGPPGTGKTFLAKIMAAQSGAEFYLVTAASLGGRLVGESEQRLESIYTDAAAQKMSIVFIDEIDVLTKDRANENDHGSRLVNVFLTNMDGVDSPTNVITVGTTNRVGDIDRALRRPGRFDRELTFRSPNLEDRKAILSSGNHVRSENFDYGKIADATDGWTAAEVGAIWQYAAEMTVLSERTRIAYDHFMMGFERAKCSRDRRLAGK